MSLKNKISELIEQQFSIKYHDNYLAYTIHNWAASEISDSITFCIIGCGNCKIGYQDVAKSFNITKDEIDQGNIASIESKIKSEAEKSGSEFSELISRVDQSLKEQSEKSIVQILDSSAEEMLRSFCDSPVQSPEPQEPSASSEEHATEGPETSVNSDLLST
ncbi:WBM0748 family T4SS-associated protein [Wolbachia endosymbiont (group A) of Ancistrocerus nigricornis]|uniref:WBM0748 family T4SS-associated protein n=1 Tax=Wolbachia endosymbiont (group A) of Ancistrocerus nigricornis TaxID=2953974 RepID=UPI0022268286|nr:hypothetical protein [Wolbachia endosymbiont (group A) of Ancistrocerus nigricornis]